MYSFGRLLVCVSIASGAYVPCDDTDGDEGKPAFVAIEGGDGIGAVAPLTEIGYQHVASLGSDSEMKLFIRRVIESAARSVGDEGGLSGLVPFYSGTKMVQQLSVLQAELQSSSWITDGAGRMQPLTQEGYENVAKLQSDEHMNVFVHRLLSENGLKCIDDNALTKFIPRYSGRCQTQNFEKLKNDVLSMAWAVESDTDDSEVSDSIPPEYSGFKPVDIRMIHSLTPPSGNTLDLIASKGVIRHGKKAGFGQESDLAVSAWMEQVQALEDVPAEKTMYDSSPVDLGDKDTEGLEKIDEKDTEGSEKQDEDEENEMDNTKLGRKRRKQRNARKKRGSSKKIKKGKGKSKEKDADVSSDELLQDESPLEEQPLPEKDTGEVESDASIDKGSEADNVEKEAHIQIHELSEPPQEPVVKGKSNQTGIEDRKSIGNQTGNERRASARPTKTAVKRIEDAWRQKLRKAQSNGSNGSKERNYSRHAVTEQVPTNRSGVKDFDGNDTRHHRSELNWTTTPNDETDDDESVQVIHARKKHVALNSLGEAVDDFLRLRDEDHSADHAHMHKRAMFRGTKNDEMGSGRLIGIPETKFGNSFVRVHTAMNKTIETGAGGRTATMDSIDGDSNNNAAEWSGHDMATLQLKTTGGSSSHEWIQSVVNEAVDDQLEDVARVSSTGWIRSPAAVSVLEHATPVESLEGNFVHYEEDDPSETALSIVSASRAHQREQDGLGNDDIDAFGDDGETAHVQHFDVKSFMEAKEAEMNAATSSKSTVSNVTLLGISEQDGTVDFNSMHAMVEKRELGKHLIDSKRATMVEKKHVFHVTADSYLREMGIEPVGEQGSLFDSRDSEPTVVKTEATGITDKASAKGDMTNNTNSTTPHASETDDTKATDSSSLEANAAKKSENASDNSSKTSGNGTGEANTSAEHGQVVDGVPTKTGNATAGIRTTSTVLNKLGNSRICEGWCSSNLFVERVGHSVSNLSSWDTKCSWSLCSGCLACKGPSRLERRRVAKSCQAWCFGDALSIVRGGARTAVQFTLGMKCGLRSCIMCEACAKPDANETSPREEDDGEDVEDNAFPWSKF